MFLRQFEYLIALEKEGHFGRAAERCHVSQPSLSSGLNQLEEELGVPIILRHQRFQGFTPEGECVINWTKRLLADQKGMLEDLAIMRRNLHGTIRIGAMPMSSPVLPIINNISDVSMDEDDTYSFYDNYSDVDSDLSASASSNSDDVTVSIDSGSDSGEITIILNDDYFGTSSSSVTVTDGEASVSSTFIITVDPVNDAPVITSTPSSTDVEIGTAFSYQLTASDVDDIVFSYGISGAPDGMTISDGGLIDWSPDTHGSYGPVTLTVSDGEASDSQSINVTSYFVDCAGVTNGNNVVDNCGTCDSDSTNDCTQDCAGTWGGSLVVDECNICGGDNSSCADCAGVPNGSSTVDNCDVCDDDPGNDIYPRRLDRPAKADQTLLQ